MKVLLDNCVDGRFAGDLADCEVVHARSVGWERLKNGELLRAAEEAGFDVLITVDKQMRHQQNLRGRQICLLTIVTRFVTYPDIQPLAGRVSVALLNMQRGTSIDVSEG